MTVSAERATLHGLGAPPRRSPAKVPFTREPLAEIKFSASRYLVKPLVPRVGVGVIAGPSTSAKTFFALEMTLRISRGEDFHGLRVQQAGVLYISAEDPEGVVPLRRGPP